ncbi:MAG: hypothetical protein JXM68_00415, partial [Sedimentisphaerales bacterium]|nr:hypothetical protein [Sedimentisphaerales bacterium]
MKKFWLSLLVLVSICQYSLAALTVSDPAGGNIWQYDNVAIGWTSDNIADGSLVSIILCQNGIDYDTLSTGQTNVIGPNSYSWSVGQSAGGNYSIKVISESDPNIFAFSPTFAVVAPTITANASAIAQFDDLIVSWSVAGAISNDVTIVVVENSQSAVVSDGSTSYNFTTDNSADWLPGTYTIVVTSSDQPTISDSITVSVSATAISGVSSSGISQYEDLTVSWSESGSLGASVLVTASNGGFSQSTTVSAGTGTATFTTDTSWPAGSYSISVSSVSHPSVTASTS